MEVPLYQRNEIDDHHDKKEKELSLYILLSLSTSLNYLLFSALETMTYGTLVAVLFYCYRFVISIKKRKLTSFNYSFQTKILTVSACSTVEMILSLYLKDKIFIIVIVRCRREYPQQILVLWRQGLPAAGRAARLHSQGAHP